LEGCRSQAAGWFFLRQIKGIDEVMKAAVYPGSFDPVTVGHIDIIKRASKIFDRVIVLVMTNTAKSTMFTEAERVDFIQKAVSCPNVEAEAYDGLLADYCREKGVYITVRGLRQTIDFEYEYQIAQVNRYLEPEIETVLLYAADGHGFISSSVAREMITRGGNLRNIVPDGIIEYIEKINNGGKNNG